MLISSGSVIEAASTGWLSPTANYVYTTGFTNPNNAHADGSGVASRVGSADGVAHVYRNYNFPTIPSEAVIQGIEVRLDWYLNNTYGTNRILVYLSWDGGTSWTPYQSATQESTNTGNSEIVGGTTDDWDRTWSLSNFTNANFRVRLELDTTSSNREFYIDWVPVRLTYNLPPNAPTNTAPAAGATVTTRNPTLSWSAFSDPDTTAPGNQQSQYQVQVRMSTDAYGGTNSEDSGMINGTGNTYTPASFNMPDGSYCWHVRVSDNSGASNSWSAYSAETCSFTVDANVAPTAPALADPPNGEIVVTGTPTLDWNAATDPDPGDSIAGYGVRIDGGAFVDVGTATSYTPATALTNGSHSWQVRACDTHSACSTSATWNFTVNTNIISANQDAYVDQTNIGSNYGTNTQMYVRSDYNWANGNRRMFLRFNAPPITSCYAGTSPSIVQATLRVYADSASALRTYDVYRATESWTEGGINWGNQSATAGSATASTNVSATGWVDWDVTADVQNFSDYGGANTNYGWMIRDRSESESLFDAYETRFRAREYSGSSTDPQLLISYNCSPSVPALVSPANNTSINTATPLLDWNAATDPDGDTLRYSVSVDGGAWTSPTPDTLTEITWSLLSEGQHNWQVRAFDGRINSESETWSFTVDTDIPVAPAALNEGNPDLDYYPGTTYSLPINWAGVADTGSGISYEVYRSTDGGVTFPTLVYSNTNTSFTDNGTFADNTYLFYRVRARTGAGILSPGWTTSDGVRIDSEIPATITGAGEGLIAGTDDDWSRDNAYLVFWNIAPDTGSGITYEVQRSVNGGAYTTFTPSGQTCDAARCWGDDPVGHSNGNIVRYLVRAINGAGNAGAWATPSDGITIDLALPDSSVTTGGVYRPATWPGSISGTAGDPGGSGVIQVNVRVRDTNTGNYWTGATWATGETWVTAVHTTGSWSYSFPAANLTDGHTYGVDSRATDGAGNIQTTFGNNNFTYSSSAPDAPVPTSPSHPVPTAWYNDNQPSFTWNVPASSVAVQGYSIVLDQFPGTIPDTIQDTTDISYDAATTPDGIWYFHVRAVNIAGTWGPSGHVRVNIDTTTPQSPASVTEENPDVDFDADGNITVYWSAVPNTGSGITYELQRSVNGGGYTFVISTTATSYAHNPGGYADGNTVRYQVRAVNGVGLSNGFTQSDGMTIDSSPVAAPAWVYEDATTALLDRDYHNQANGAVTVHWAGVTDTGSGITYRLERWVSTNPTVWTLVAQNLSATAYADSGSYSDGQQIRYRVTAVNGVGTPSALTLSDGFTIDLDIPALPGYVYEGSATVDLDYDDDGSFTVYWGQVTSTGSGITYRLEKSVDSGDWALVSEDISDANYADTNPDALDGAFIRFRVTAVNGAGTSGSYRLSDGITLDRDAPANPAWIYENNPDVDFDTDGATLVNWAPVAGTGSGTTYTLQKRVNSGEWADVATNLIATSYNDTVTYGDETLIQYQVIARNGVGRLSDWTTSDGVRVDTGTPGAPASVGEGLVINTDLDYVNVNAFNVFWTDVSSTATGDTITYRIERNANGGGWALAAANVSATSWDDPQAYSNGDQVFYRVTAVNGAGTAGSTFTTSDGIRIDTGQPNSVVATTGYYNAATWPDRVQGTASDDYSGVARVDITLYDTDAGLYWNGTSWVAGETWLLAAGTTNWTYALVDSALTDGNTYNLESRATDSAGNVQVNYGINSFTFAASGPPAPVISSAGHPVQTTWYNNNDPAFTWTEPTGPAPISGYSYALDQSAGTTPDAVVDTTGTANSYTNVSDGTWYFHVRALDTAGTWGPAGHYRVNIDTATPNDPSNVTEESPDVDYDLDGSVTVNWNAVSNTGSGIVYIVERQIGAGTWAVISDTVQSTQYLDPATGYADGTVIHYRVSARNGVGLTGATAQSDGVTVDSDAPTTPAWISENGNGQTLDEDYDPDGSVRVYWAASTDTGSGLTYRLDRRITTNNIPGSWVQIAGGLSGTSYLDPRANQDGETIHYRVTAVNGVSNSSAVSLSDGIFIDTDIPAAPAAVTENSPDTDWSVDGAVIVFWGGVADTGSGITYRLEKQINSGDWTLVADALAGGTTNYADSSTYYSGDTVRYRVHATNNAGVSGVWRESDGMTIDSGIVAAPGWVREENPDIDFDADGAVTVYWAAVTNTGSGITYRLEKQIGAGSWNILAPELAGTSYYDGQTQPDGVVVHYRVSAENAVGTVGNPTTSDGITVDTQPPAAPTGLGEGDIVNTDDTFDQDNTFYVYWAAPADTGSGLVYEIQRRPNGGSWVAAASEVEDTSWEDPTPYSNGDTIQYRVRAVNGAGLEGAWSEASSGITLDFVAPDSTVTTHGYYNAFNWPGAIFGTAADTGSNVEVVNLTIQRASDGYYWNGATWQASEFWLLATNTINWQYTFAPADGETYDIRSRGTDHADNVEITLGTESFTYSSSGPQAPEISSSTHPVEATWYTANSATFNWTQPTSAAPVVGYSYALDQNPGSTPDAVADTTARTITSPTLADGAWYFHVRALDNAGNWGPSDHFAVHIDTATPQTPAGITEESPDVDFDADGDFTIYWSGVANTGSGITYHLERQTGAGAWQEIAATTTTSYADSGTYADGVALTYRVRAVNGVGYTSDPATSDGLVIDSQTPAAPAYVREGVATDPDWAWDADGAFTVYWGNSAETGSGIQYRLYRRINGGAWLLLATTANTSYADSGTYANGTLLEYQVSAINGVGLFSDPALAVSNGIHIDNNIPGTPAAVTEGSPDVDFDVDGAFTVTWGVVTDTGSGISYRLERNLNNAGWVVLAAGQSATTYADDISATDGTTALYRVTAINGVGAEGTPRVSDGVTVDSQVVPQPGWVREDSAVEPDRDYHPTVDGTITVYWASVTDTGSGIRYRLEKRVDGSATWTLVAANLTGASHPDSGAYADNNFIEYRVTAVNGVLTESAPRASDGMRIDTDTPAAPTAVGEGDIAGTDDDFDENNIFYVYWTASADTGSGITYTIQRSRNGSAWEQATTGLACATTPCRWDDAAPYSNGDTVEYRVIAVNGAGHESATSAASDGLTLDFEAPGSAISTQGYYNSFNWPGYINGTAADTLSGVNTVALSIRRSTDNQYFNGTTWQAAEAWLAVTGTLNWQYPFAPADGTTYTLRSRAVDNANNTQSTLGTSTFIYTASGPQAPVISSSTHANEAMWYNHASPAFNWTTPTSGAGIQGYSYALDQSPTTLPDTSIESNINTFSYTDLADGVWYFHIRAQDNANNWSQADHFAVHIDTAAPAAPAAVTEETPDVDWDSDGSVTVNWSAVTDTGSPITYRLERNLNNTGWTLAAENLTATAYTSGGYLNGNTVMFRVRAVDSVPQTGSWATSDGVSFDTTIPATPTGVGEGDVIGTDDDWDQDNTFFVFWNAVAGTPSGITYSVERNRNNSGVWEPMISGLTATNWDDLTSYSSGENVAYRVTAHTGAGLSGPASASSDGLTLDGVSPDSAVSTNGYYNNFSWPGSIAGTATDELSDVAVVQITLQRQDNLYFNGATWVAAQTWLAATGTLNWQYTFAPVNGQTYTVQSRATDVAGNVETTFGAGAFNFASEGPAAPIISSVTHPDEVVWSENNDPAFTWTVPASGSGIQGYSYLLDQVADTEPDLSADTNGTNRSYTNISDGILYFHVRALDNANNWGPADHYRVNIDTANPFAPTIVTEESPDVDWDADGNITVYWDTVEDLSGVTYTLRRSTNGGGAWTIVTTGLTQTHYLDPVTYADGVMVSYSVQAVDAVNHLSPWRVSNGVTIDSETPAQPAHVNEGDVVGSDDTWDEDNAFYIFWDTVANTGSGVTYTIERRINGGAWNVAQTDYAQTFWEDPQIYADTERVEYQITAINGVGTNSPVSATSSGLTFDFAEPNSIITTAGTYGPASWPGNITGTSADATSGVNLIRLSIRRSNGDYWNGAAWVATQQWLQTTGTTAWSYAFTPADGETYTLLSRAIDNAGNAEVSYGTSSFNYTTTEPDSSVETGGLYVGAAWTGQITGTALAPAAALSHVDITIRRASDDRYFNGANWIAAATWLRTTGTALWRYTFTPADGETYIVASRATDAVDNVETNFGGNTFSYDAAAPEIELITAASDNSYFYNPGLTTTGGTVYFNSRAAEGAGQTLTVTVSFIEPHPVSLTAGTAFGDNPVADTSAPWTASYSVEANAGTQSNVAFTVADALGLEDAAAITFVQDNLAPESEASLADDSTNAPTIEVNWTAADSLSGVAQTHLWVKFQPLGAWTDTGLSATGISGSFVYTPTAGTGTYYFATLAVDNVGNRQTEPAGLGDDAIYVDNLAPGSTMTAPEYAIESPITITWSASQDTKYTYLFYRYGESGNFVDTGLPFSEDQSGTFRFEPADGDGHYYFATVAIDAAGNLEPIAADGKDMTIFDTIAPTSAAQSPADAWDTFSFTVTVDGTDTAIGSGVAFYDVEVKQGISGEWTSWLTNTTATSAVFTATFTGLPETTYYFRSRATDNAGHVEAWPTAAAGDTETVIHFPGNFPGKYEVFLPLVSNNAASSPAPTGPEIELVIRNCGDTDAVGAFWVDLYIDPNESLGYWPISNGEGYNWFGQGAAFSISTLGAGQDLVLYLDDADDKNLPNPLPVSPRLYAQVDSIGLNDDGNGVILEGIAGETNNISGNGIGTTCNATPGKPDLIVVSINRVGGVDAAKQNYHPTQSLEGVIEPPARTLPHH